MERPNEDDYHFHYHPDGAGYIEALEEYIDWLEGKQENEDEDSVRRTV